MHVVCHRDSFEYKGHFLEANSMLVSGDLVCDCYFVKVTPSTVLASQLFSCHGLVLLWYSSCTIQL